MMEGVELCHLLIVSIFWEVSNDDTYTTSYNKIDQFRRHPPKSACTAIVTTRSHIDMQNVLPPVMMSTDWSSNIVHFGEVSALPRETMLVTSSSESVESPARHCCVRLLVQLGGTMATDIQCIHFVLTYILILFVQ